jgi:hypothetical protein
VAARGARAASRQDAAHWRTPRHRAAADAVFQVRIEAFVQERADLGSIIGRNFQIDTR